MTWKLVGAAAMALAVAACGTQPGERTTGGAAAGAATGAGIGALGGPVGALAGAAIGAGAGAVTGAATSPSQVNLGAPPWDNPRARIPGVEEGSSGTQYSANQGQYQPYGSSGQYGYQQQYSSRTVRQAQRALQQRGFDPGPIDGIYGPQTASAIENFQRANNMQADGQLDSQMLQALNVNQSGNTSATQTGSNNRSGNAAGGGSGSNMNNNMNNTGMNNPGVNSTGSTGPGGTSGTGSGNQPGTGGTSQQSR